VHRSSESAEGAWGKEANILSKVQISFSSMSAPSSSRWSRVVVTLACATLLSSCGHVSQSNGEKLARVDCAACHMFPNPDLLDKKTWVSGVLPQMAPRLGLPAPSLDEEMARSPYMTVLSRPVSAEGWVCRTLLDGCRGSEAGVLLFCQYVCAVLVY